MEVKVNIIDTLFTTIPKNTVVASYTIDEDSVDLTMLNDQYSFNTANKTILTSSNVTSNNLKAINFTARNWVSGEQVEINDMYPRVVSKLQNKFNKPNTIYKVCADIDLGGGELTIATGSTLDFQGGSFSNGTIVGQNTKVLVVGNPFNDTITVSGNIYDINGINILALTKGTTEQRPTNTIISEGFEYYDSTLKKMILWNGTAWTNLDGTALT